MGMAHRFWHVRTVSVFSLAPYVSFTGRYKIKRLTIRASLVAYVSLSSISDNSGCNLRSWSCTDS